MDRKVTGNTVESPGRARKETARPWILAGTTLAAGLALSALTVAACSPLSAAAPSGTTDQPLSVRQTEAAMFGNQVNQDVAAATAWAQATDDEAARMEQRNHAVETQQALALQAITVTAEAARANLQMQAEAYSHTLALSEAQTKSEIEQQTYADTLAAQKESARVIAEGEATRSEISGWIWLGGGLLVLGLAAAILVALLYYVVRWVQSGMRKMHMTELAHAQALSRALPAGDVWIPFDRNPYRTLIRVGGELQPAYEFLGLPAPGPDEYNQPVSRRDTIPTHGRSGEGELDREPTLDAQTETILTVLKNCELMVGKGATRLPTRRAYVARWNASPNTYQDVVNALAMHLEGRGKDGTVIVSRRCPTLGELVQGVRSGQIRPGPARVALVPSDQIEIVESGD